jgi:hypothetical protein
VPRGAHRGGAARRRSRPAIPRAQTNAHAVMARLSAIASPLRPARPRRRRDPDRIDNDGHEQRENQPEPRSGSGVVPRAASRPGAGDLRHRRRV